MKELIAYELGYRTAVSNRLSIDFAAYYNDYDNLQTTEPGTPFAESTPAPASFGHPAHVREFDAWGDART